MALEHRYTTAETLDSLSWVAFPEGARNSKLVHLYLKEEHKIKDYCRKYKRPTTRTVTIFIKSLYHPPRGAIRDTVEAVMEEIERQRGIKLKRKKFAPWVQEDPNTAERRARVARRRYTVWDTNWNGKKNKEPHYCTGIGSVSNVSLMVDSYNYGNRCARIYMRDKATNNIKVVVLDVTSKLGLSDALLKLAPKGAIRSIFGGASIKLDFEQEGFMVNGELMPWQRVCKVYRGRKAAHEMMTQPKN